MKAKNQILYLLTAGMFCVTSCVKHGDVYQPKAPESTADLVVPEGFEWSSSRTVSLAVQSPVATVASFFVDEACTPENQIATLAVPEGKTTFEFDVPNENTAIYVQYTSTDGTTKTLKSAINGVKSKAIEGADDLFMVEPQEPASQGTVQFVNIPKGNRYGTLMFEDKWPEIGDFDFNDVVINYRINATYDPGVINPENPQDPKKDIVINVDLKIKALGGLYPYDFAIQIGQTRSHEGSSINASYLGDISLSETTNENITVEKLEGTEFPAVIVKGLNTLRSSSYYNTISKTDEGVNLSFKVNIKGTLAEQSKRMQSAFNDPKAFDYFLINTETHREIHLKGFKPTALYTSYDADNTAGGEYYYENDAHLVWGLKVPQEIGWAKEKQDILKVYTRFEEWVTSGGKALEPGTSNPLLWYKYHSDENYIQP